MSHAPDPSQQLIASLHRPRAYPHPVEKIELLETHISWVLLTGAYAYKVKKPVDLDFLNFSTLEKRKFYCQEELRLNRRLSPEIYLDVVPITGTVEAPTVTGSGTPIEYAVRMRQFSQDALLGNVLERGELKPRHIDALAQQVAAFHQRIEKASADSPCGTLEMVRKNTEDNLAELSRGEETDAVVERLRSWCRGELEACKAHFLRRREQGLVRECHGDMHLGNMLLLDDQPVVFDCIEFNERFRWIDVMSELAFAVMDLEDRGSVASARRLLKKYLEETGDYGGLAVFRYYLVYRALVRAKVTSIRLDQGHLSGEEQDDLLDDYLNYLKLADQYTRAATPFLAITHGASGSGKSTVALAVVEEVGAIQIRSDVERKRLLGINPLEDTAAKGAAEAYSSDTTERTYARLAELAETIVRAGYPAVVDATFLKLNQRLQFRRLAGELRVPFAILDLQATEAQMRERVSQRASTQADASEASQEVLAQQLATREPLEREERAYAVAVSSNQPQAAVAELLRRLPAQQKPRPNR